MTQDSGGSTRFENFMTGRISWISKAETDWNSGILVGWGGSDQALSGSMKSWRPSNEKRVVMSDEEFQYRKELNLKFGKVMKKMMIIMNSLMDIDGHLIFGGLGLILVCSL
ncbi:hypothetical protein RchiOBHm_Chr7g0210131 [Rosa chinensis]|uniref:Uncharacterized protein n=1 Tax=Rosa chinensis TaxID=74649 RepID=A0A2P6PA54_ROSCH|nr:hypothetical protein RchiOBHm_Chr7g0210131 [Rosa chinensis]